MASLTYNSNPNLKAANVDVQYTQEQVEEYIKCSQDPIYFIDTYCKIISLDYGIIPFNLYECQRKKVKIIHENRKVILMEGRQQGKTQTSAAYILWYVNFNNAKNVAILANKSSAAREVMSRLQLMFELLPHWLKCGVKTWNKGDIELENKSKVFTAATTGSGIRGKTVNMLYIDETAFIPNSVADEFFTSVYPTISSGQTSKILLSSTPLGYNHFWKFWTDAEKGHNDFVPLFIPYWEIPGRDAAWAEEQRRQLGDLKYCQEVECSFLGSSLTLIPAETLSKLSPSVIDYSREGLDVFEIPERGRNYVMTIDPSKGVGGDNSTIQVIDITEIPYRQVAKYKDNHMSPLLFPNIIYKVARDYNNAHVLIEINISEQVAHILHHELEYENMIIINKKAKGLDRGQSAGGGFGGRSFLGVTTDKKTKRIGCANLKSLLVENKLLINDMDTISELSTFIEVKDSYAADDSYKDDLVMGLVIFSWLTTQPYFKELNNVELRQIMYQNQMRLIEEELTPFGFYDDGQIELEAPIMLLNF
jgi:hypothetical protein